MEPSPARPPKGPEAKGEKPRIGLAEVVGDGVFAGLVGASAVALWFLAVDAVLREPLYTPSMVAGALLRGTPAAAEQSVDLTMVAAFTALHSFLFILFGIAASWIVDQFQRTPDMPLISIAISWCRVWWLRRSVWFPTCRPLLRKPRRASPTG
jgi:hypothetical protein